MKKLTPKQPAKPTNVKEGWLDGAPKSDQVTATLGALPLLLGRDPETVLSSRKARLTIDLPTALHRKFKMACLLDDTTMVGEVIAFIRLRVDKPSLNT